MPRRDRDGDKWSKRGPQGDSFAKYDGGPRREAKADRPRPAPKGDRLKRATKNDGPRPGPKAEAGRPVPKGDALKRQAKTDGPRRDRGADDRQPPPRDREGK
jgi:hypothetical protein